jgi:DNA-binding response OmpR family regulator
MIRPTNRSWNAGRTSCSTLGNSNASGSQAALLISPDASDKTFLAEVFQRHKWHLHAVRTLGTAMEALRDQHFPVIITEEDLPPGSWRNVLAAVEQLPNAPLLVVTSGLADERLWSEVLNLGGHDVLAKPFCEAEVLHVLTHAWRRLAGSEHITSTESGARRTSCRLPSHSLHWERSA